MVGSQLYLFFQAISQDGRISSTHIGIFVALLEYWRQNKYPQPLVLYCKDLMPLAKISSSTTYHRCMRELDAYGYIKYIPSFKRNQGSKVFFVLEEKAKF